MRAKVAQDGGKELNGWQLWTWPKVFIEAEHHCVWKSPEGNLIDVTPKENGEKRIAFLPDPAVMYDHENHRRIDNIRKALSIDPDIDEYLNLAASLYRLIEDGSMGTGLTAKVLARDLSNLQSRRTQIHGRLTRRYIKPKDFCPCGSGKKYFRCHGKLKDK
ncbi:MAG: SEC-C metal-binding domain-containing protein [Rhodospirillales bacterium]|nr:SEC-C metal-binding domain-containing protein [Rhodospirillales bacterium]